MTKTSGWPGNGEIRRGHSRDPEGSGSAPATAASRDTERRPLHARGPDHRAGGDPSSSPSPRPECDRAPAHLRDNAIRADHDAQPGERPHGRGGEFRGEGRQDVLPPPRGARCGLAAEILRNSAAGSNGRVLPWRRPSRCRSDRRPTYERQPGLALGVVLEARPPRTQTGSTGGGRRVLEGLQSRHDHLPVSAAEIVVADPGRQHQRVVGKSRPRHCTTLPTRSKATTPP